jgi:hypothetical protein
MTNMSQDLMKDTDVILFNITCYVNLSDLDVFS